jgi:hypothetical protein
VVLVVRQLRRLAKTLLAAASAACSFTTFCSL